MTLNDDKKLLSLQKSVIYGPVNSRRLGRSLGINVLPPYKKICSFDCAYCQYGYSTPVDTMTESRNVFPSLSTILGEIEGYLNQIDPCPSYITFSGNGEATLHPDFLEIVDGIILLRNRYCPSARTAILSNSTEVIRPEIRNSLSRLDHRIMKLDAGNQQILASYNQPHKKISIENIVDGLMQLKDITIQSLWSGGPAGNFIQKNISDWIERIQKIQPSMVQLYTLDRTPPCISLQPVSRQQLLEISIKLKDIHILSQVF